MDLTLRSSWKLRFIRREIKLKRTYELVAIFDPTAENEIREERIKALEKILEERTTLSKPKEVWGRRRLAYPIKKKNEGIYILWTFEAEPAIIDVINNHIFYEELIIRKLIVVVDKKQSITKKEIET